MIRLPKMPKLIVRRRVLERRSDYHVNSAAENVEHARCHPNGGAPHFLHWARRHARIQDAVTKVEGPFIPWPGQQRLVQSLVDREWLLILKARQLGFTWLLVAYVAWRICFSHVYTTVCVNQEIKYAKIFVQRVKWILSRLPAWCCERPSVDNKEVLEFTKGGSRRELYALVGGEKAGRSLTGDLVIFDEAAYIAEFGDTYGATYPAVESARGQMVVLSTSAGPVGDFYNLWTDTYGDHGQLLDENRVGPTGFRVFFMHWSERPGRDQDWYDRQKTILDHIGPCVVKQEYPDSPEEAFEHAAGRVYPFFTRDRCVGQLTAAPTDEVERYRGIDWGETKSAYVVLWAMHFPGPPGLIFHPSCHNSISEFLGYRWDPDRPGVPVKSGDHAPDVVRYMVTTFKLTGLVYIYREIYRMDSIAKGWNPMKEIREIHEASGWVKDPNPRNKRDWMLGIKGERYEGTVADRSWQKAIALFREYGIPCRGQKVFRAEKPAKGESVRDTPLSEIQEGIRMVSALVDGSEDIGKRIEVVRDQHALEIYRAHRRRRTAGKVPFTVGLPERALHNVAKRLLAVQRRRT